jgi:hypothetical protein
MIKTALIALAAVTVAYRIPQVKEIVFPDTGWFS